MSAREPNSMEREPQEREPQERETPEWVREWRQFRRESDERIRLIKEQLARLRECPAGAIDGDELRVRERRR